LSGLILITVVILICAVYVHIIVGRIWASRRKKKHCFAVFFLRRRAVRSSPFADFVGFGASASIALAGAPLARFRYLN
jgi:hypothetical protein